MKLAKKKEQREGKLDASALAVTQELNGPMVIPAERHGKKAACREPTGKIKKEN